MATKSLPDVSYVRECVRYDADTGVFTWRERPPHHFPHWKAHIWWNAKFAGKIAGRGSCDRNNYWRLSLGSRSFHAHRVAWLLIYGEPVPEMLDHIDGNTLNNRVNNLRPATNAGNMANARRHARTTSTNVKGVFLRRRGNCTQYIAHIGINGKKRTLCSFATLEEATKARREAAERLHGHFVRHE